LAFRPMQTTVDLTLSCRAKRRDVNQSIQLTLIIAYRVSELSWHPIGRRRRSPCRGSSHFTVH